MIFADGYSKITEVKVCNKHKVYIALMNIDIM